MLGYVLMLTIAALLISGLLIASGDLVRGERERAVRTELTVVGEQLAGDVSTVDNLVQSSDASPSRARVAHEFPADVTGSSYTISVETSPDRLVLRSADPEVQVAVSLATETPVSATSLSGGPVRVVYTGSALEVRSA